MITTWWEKKYPLLLKNISYIASFSLIITFLLIFTNPIDHGIFLYHTSIRANRLVPIQAFLLPFEVIAGVIYIHIDGRDWWAPNAGAGLIDEPQEDAPEEDAPAEDAPEEAAAKQQFSRLSKRLQLFIKRYGFFILFTIGFALQRGF